MPNSTAKRQVTVSVLSTPEPSWFKSSSLTAGSWASWLMMAHQYGRVVDHPAGIEIDANHGDFYILLNGTMVVSTVPPDPNLKPLFIDTLRRGDIIVPSRHTDLKFTYVVRGSASLLKVSKDKFNAFMNDMKNSEVVLMAAELNLLTKHATAASTVQMKDQDKIWRVVVNLASHPDVAHRPGCRGEGHEGRNPPPRGRGTPLSFSCLPPVPGKRTGCLQRLQTVLLCTWQGGPQCRLKPILR